MKRRCNNRKKFFFFFFLLYRHNTYLKTGSVHNDALKAMVLFFFFENLVVLV